MGPRLRVDSPLEALLDAVVADRRGRVESVGDGLLGEPGKEPAAWFAQTPA